ncbi:hypothetical protein GXP67_35395 [Rhodocytophaga rosea]|uniref:Yeast cell wall synthesis Kre9/Knh1-like N-terminal domain-containing protein n=1 Tax=Rhodocytophaga rosea TaxID=2704465 RepID=A0A6C0GTS9_9BACT|nr:Ser-Thr-rich GPI-anchored membrane family protein [Rhodocytophaga rosea]QHT71578.1 hypothetical protein GXP67_35395 [Rhodocytophaga rosea]
MKIYLPPLLFLGLLTFTSYTYGQRVTNVRAQARGNVVTLTYDLQGTIIGQLYKVEVFSSHNEMAQPLVHVRGEVGPDMKPGINKIIEWGSMKELGDYDGEISLEVRATLTFSPIRFTTPKSNAIYKRGKSYKFNWLGALPNENLQLELYSDTTRQYELGRLLNKGVYQWEIPVNAAPGKTYRLKISSVETPGNFIFSNYFTIKRKTPTAWKVVPAGVITGVALYLILKGDKDNPIVEEDLPLPPKPK